MSTKIWRRDKNEQRLHMRRKACDKAARQQINDSVNSSACEFVRQLRREMEKQEVTQAMLAERLEVTESAVSQFFSGCNFTLRSAMRYAHALGMKVAVVGVALLFLCVAGFAQDATPSAQCPAGLICLTRDAAQKALEAGDRAKALEAELATQKQAYEKMRDALNDMRIQFASVSGENTALKQNAVSDRAIIEVLLKATKKKCFPLSICF